MYSLIALKKLHNGTIDPHNKRDIAKVAPFILESLKLDNPALTEAMLWANVDSAEDTQTAYWHWFEKISDKARKPAIFNWVLDQYSKHPYPLPPEFKKDGRNSLYYDLYYPMLGYALENSREMSLKTAGVLAERFAADILSHNNDQSTFEFQPHSFQNWDLSDPAIIGRIADLLTLTDEIDTVVGTKNSRYSVIRSLFTSAFLSTTHPEVRNSILSHADNLPMNEKKRCIDRYYACHITEEKKSLCKNTFYAAGHNLFTHSDRAALDSYLTHLKKWDHENEDLNCINAFFDEHVKWPMLRIYGEEFEYLSSFDLMSQFDPRITWADLTERLQIFLDHYNIDHKIDFTEPEYIRACVERSFTYGHIEDARMITDFLRNLSAEKREEYYLDAETGLPRSNRFRIARVPEIIELYCSLYSKETLQFWTSYSKNPLQKLKIFILPNSDHDRFDYNRCSYFQDGIPLKKEEITRAFPTVLSLIEENLPENEEEKKAALQQVIDKDSYTSFRCNFDIFRETCDKESAIKLFEFLDRHNIEKIDSRLEYGGYMVPQIRYIVDVLTDLKKQNEVLFKEIFQNLTRWTDKSFSKELVVASYFPDEAVRFKEAFETPAFKMLRGKLDEIFATSDGLDEAEGSIYELYFPCRDHFYGAPESGPSEKIAEEILPVAKIIAKIEGNEAAGNNSQKLAQLFTTYQKAATFVERHAQPGRQPLHDLCLFTVTQKPFNKEIWENLAIRYGGGATRYLAFADKIEKYIDELNERRRALNISFGKKGNDIEKGMIDLRRLKPSQIGMIASRVAYEGAEKNRDVADFCLHHGASQEGFEETVRLTEEFNACVKPIPDNTPDIHVDGSNIGLDGYSMQKIAKGDLINLWVGKLVNCCNHLDYAGRDMAKAQFSGPDNALYVIFDRHQKPVAKFSGWMSEKGNLVFNAWERLSPAHDFLMSRFALAASLQVLEDNPSIKRVTMGAGPIKKDTVPFKFLKEERAEKAAEHVGKTYDSNEQFLIAARRREKDAETLLAELMAENAQRGEVTVKLTNAERALNAA